MCLIFKIVPLILEGIFSTKKTLLLQQTINKKEKKEKIKEEEVISFLGGSRLRKEDFFVLFLQLKCGVWSVK